MNIRKLTNVSLIITFLVILGGCTNHKDDSYSSLGQKVFNSGAPIVFAPNASNLKDWKVFDVINNEEVQPCDEWDNSKMQTNNACEIQVIEEQGRVLLIKKNGEKIVPDDVLKMTVIRHTGSICYTFKNGGQVTRCYPERLVQEYCDAHNNGHEICNLL